MSKTSPLIRLYVARIHALRKGEQPHAVRPAVRGESLGANWRRWFQDKHAARVHASERSERNNYRAVMQERPHTKQDELTRIETSRKNFMLKRVGREPVAPFAVRSRSKLCRKGSLHCAVKQIKRTSLQSDPNDAPSHSPSMMASKAAAVQSSMPTTRPSNLRPRKATTAAAAADGCSNCT